MVKGKIYLPYFIDALVLMDSGMSLMDITHYQRCTYAYLHGLFKDFVKKGLVIDKGKIGRKKHYELTEKGRELKDVCEELIILTKGILDDPIEGYWEYQKKQKQNLKIKERQARRKRTKKREIRELISREKELLNELKEIQKRIEHLQKRLKSNV